MEIKINNEDYKNLELEYSKVKIRGIEYRVEECNGKLNIVKISDGSECVMNLTMTQHSMAIIVSNIEEANNIKKALLSNKFNDFLKTVMWSNFQIDWKLFSYLKKDFWKDFI